jgi:hypothetical protein
MSTEYDAKKFMYGIQFAFYQQVLLRAVFDEYDVDNAGLCYTTNGYKLPFSLCASFVFFVLLVVNLLSQRTQRTQRLHKEKG